MAVPLENIVGFIRIKRDAADPERGSLYIDDDLPWAEAPGGLKRVTIPPDTAGVLYANPLRVEFPKE